jgi:hypothetical protein
MIKRLLALLLFFVLTLLSQVGGIVLVFSWLGSRWVLPARVGGWQRAGTNVALFLGIYAAVHIFVVPPLAALGGRVPLPCSAEIDRPFAAANPVFCWLNRHYVDPRLVTLVTNLSREVARDFPGTVTLFLDANFPFLNGFPLLPHLSHGDGRKLDIAYYYQGPGGDYLPGQLRSPIGYWAFEQPGPDDSPPCRSDAWLTTRWNMRSLQSILPDRPLEAERTRAALRWLVAQGREPVVDRVFVEPYLAARLGVKSELLRFQGCRAARHDDHIHVQLKP